MSAMTKRELFIRLASLIYRMRHVNATSVLLEIDMAGIEGDLDRIEEELDRQVDDYQAGLYERHNKRPTQYEDRRGLSGRWGANINNRRFGT